MSLKVWLPLTGDLRNLGTSNLAVTINGATVDNNGKIGKCYAFNGSTSYIALSGNDLFKIFTGGTQQFSITMWVFHADTTRAILFGDFSTSGGIGFNIELSTAHAVRFYWNGSPDTYPANAAVTASGWTHIALTYNGTKLQSYINGVEKGSWSGTLATKNKTSGEFRLGRDNRSDSTAFNGRMNDFRVYDHCLSLSEIKEIAQGLILHYKLNGNVGLGNPNLLINSLVPTEGNGASGITKSITDDGIQKVTAASSNGNWVTFGNHNTTLALTKGDTFTFSLMIKSDDSVKKPTVYFQSGLGYYGMQGTMSNEWSIIYYTGTWSIDNLNTNLHLGFSSAPGTYYIKYFKLEKGSQYTPWAPAAGEFLSDLNYIQDSSGYNHNGEIINKLYISNDSARYKNSTLFNGVDDCIIVPYNTICPENIFTINLWFKKNALGSKNYETLFGGPSGFEMDTRVGSATSLSLYMASTRKGTRATGITMNEWHMITMTRDGTVEKYYVDGEFKSEIEAKSMPNGVYRIGAWASNTGQNYYGLISDFRIYATPLLDSDIKKLYNTSMSIDRANNDFIYELDENDSNRELMQGIHLTRAYSSHALSSLHNKYNENGEPYLDTNGSSIGSDYIYIKPTGKTYYYDIELSCNTGNQFYIGFHRYDKDKTPRSNDACAYIIAIKPTSDIVHKRYFGTVNLSTDETNPCDSISLRVLNGWSGTTSGVTGTATIHRFSLREVASLDHQGTMQNGILQADEFKEDEKASIYKNGIIEANQFIER